MQDMLKPLRAESLKDVFVAQFENLILSGRLEIGQRLPSERELALQLGVSRPVVHEGLVQLQVKGLVEMKPRHGAYVCDFRKDGSLAMLNSLVSYADGELEPRLLGGMLDMRQHFEVELARLAALNRGEQDLKSLYDLLDREQGADRLDAEALTDLDFDFHHCIAMASGNVVYPMLINSFRQVYTNLSRRFFSQPGLFEEMAPYHQKLVAAIESQDEKAAVDVMIRLLDHGARHLEQIILKQSGVLS